MTKPAISIFLFGAMLAAPAMAQVQETAHPADAVKVPPPLSSFERPARAMTNELRERMEAVLRQPAVIDIEVAGSGARLWSGNLRVSRETNAEYSESSRQAFEPCSGEADRESRYGGGHSRLQVNLLAISATEDGAIRYRAVVTWTRSERQCGQVAAQKTVSFEQVATLSPGGSQVLTGDGGLSVRLTRRR